jgi:ABC-type transport system involved in multi-copper enzyme maturation permease subunit
MTIWMLALNSWQENLRSRFQFLSIIFAVVLMSISLLFGLLAVDQELRVLLDFGLGLIELIGLAGAVYAAATSVLREIETKTIYLILTRPVSRTQYLLGRFAGLMLSVLAAVLLMAACHLLMLFAKGWHWEPFYLKALGGIYLKVLVTAALALFLALSSSSVLTALVIAAILWTLGHFLPEIRHLIKEGAPAPAILPLTFLSYVLPDLQLFNLRDRLTMTSLAGPEAPLWAWALYAAVYASAWLGLSRLLLRRKEF